MATRMTITHLTHDLVQKKSFVTFVWADDPSKRLGLEVPYGTALGESKRRPNRRWPIW